MVVEPADRHLNTVGLERCISAGVPMDLPIDGEPVAFIFIDPSTPALGLRTPDDGSAPVSALEHLAINTVLREQVRWFELRITAPDLFLSGYPVLCAVADRVQLDGLRVEDALSKTLRTFGRLLQRVATLSTESELGILGELYVLNGLCGAIGVEAAVSAWVGPDRAEHDFTLRTLDVEVKTTQSERRVHWISSMTQLVPTSERPLWFVSNQLTAAGAGGWSLPGFVQKVRAIAGEGSARETLEVRLKQAGWEDWLAGSLHTRWRLRAPSIALGVDEAFPRITGDALAGAGVLVPRIAELHYRIDLTSMPQPAEAPGVLTAALNAEVEG